MTSEKPSLKNSDHFHTTRLVAMDFDGTIAQTFEKSPAGIGIEEAHEHAIDHLFGPEAVDRYKKSGGLRNRAPLEVVQELEPDASEEELHELLVNLIASKLDVLITKVGTKFNDGTTWPRPVEGYFEFLVALEHMRANGQLLDTLILSSGHEPFIKKVYDEWGVQQPDYVLAQETTERYGIGNVVKPSSTLMTLAHRIWSSDYGLDTPTLNLDAVRERTLYVGDDDGKDGQLARNSNVSFVLIDPSDTARAWKRVADELKDKEAE